MASWIIEFQGQGQRMWCICTVLKMPSDKVKIDPLKRGQNDIHIEVVIGQYWVWPSLSLST